MTLQVLSPAYQSCVDEGINQSPFLIDHWCSKLVEAMYQRFIVIRDPAERQQIQDAIAVLKKNRPLIGQGFAEELKKAIADEDAVAARTARKAVHPARSISSVSFDELELMGDNQVQEAVESARLQQLVRLACESGLAGFAARLSTAQGFLVVKVDRNPLRPEIIALTLLRLLQALPVSPQTRACWLLDGAQLLGEELHSLYVLLNQLLAEQGIEPAAYGFIATPESRSGRASQRETPDTFQISQGAPVTRAFEPDRWVAEDASTRSHRKQLLTLDHLHHLLVGDYDNSSHEFSSFSDYGLDDVAHHEFSHTLPAALDVLTELEEKGLATKRAKAARLAPSEPLAKLRAHLRTDAKSLGQSLAIEVVGLMIEQIVHDARLLAPVRQVIANAEPAFLRLAVADPRFFSDKSHPARRLLETITGTSLGYASENAPGFSEFMLNLQEVAVLLTEEHASDAEHFAELLHDFERRQTRHTPEHRQAQHRAVQALLQAEQRNLIAVKIAAEIRMRPDFVEVNRIIAAFLTGPWAQVMARERLFGESGSTGSTRPVFSLTLGDVLWSLDIAQAASHRRRLLKMIPDMLKSLREGLVSIDFPLEQSRPFFDELMAVHQIGLKSQAAVPAAAPPGRHTLGKMFEAVDEPGVAQLWLAPTEVQHSGFMDDWEAPSPSGLGSGTLQPPNNASPAVSADAGSDERIELNPGDWVDLFVDMQWLRAQLTWISPQSSLFMFTSEGARKHSMTPRVLRHLLALELVKVVSQQGVLDGALDSVARTALRNSVESNSQL